MVLLIDTRELARTARTLDGTLPVAAMARLASLLAREGAGLHWQVRGERRERPDGGHEDLMHVELSADLWMQCVRCLDDAPVALRVANSFRLVDSDEQAEREDLDDSEFDVLAGSARFDLGELIEDEAIMALPAFGRHEHCELPAATSGRGAERMDDDAAAVTVADRPGADDRGARGASRGTERSRGDRNPDQAGQEPAERIKPFADLAEMMKRATEPKRRH